MRHGVFIIQGIEVSILERKYTKNEAIALLCKKAEELLRDGNARLPRRSDFSDAEVVAIKAFLGPWPRALEAAGLKPYKEKK